MITCRHAVFLSIVTASFSVLALNSAQAAFDLIDDFNIYSPDTGIDGQGDWVTANEGIAGIDVPFQVVASPGSGDGNALRTPGFAAGVATSPVARVPLAGTAGITSTIYVEFYTTNLSSDSAIGPADGGAAYGSFNTYTGFTGTGNLFARNGTSTLHPLDQSGSMATDTWYKMWMVVDDAAESTQLYVQGGAFATQTQLTGSGGTVTDFAFRSTNAFDTFMFAKGRNTPPGEDFFIDNLYVDAGNINLTVPEPPEPTLPDLVINTTTGAITVSNVTGDPIDIGYYEIRSDSGSLDYSSWIMTNLDAGEGGDPAGSGWDVAGGSDANILSEANLEGFVTLAEMGMPGDSTSLGTGFSLGQTEDVQFFFANSVGDPLQQGTVSYVTSSGQPGDFNGDGIVNIADYTVWRDNLGGDESALALGTGSGDSTVDATDYALWKTNFGAESGVGTIASLVSIPEPTTANIAILVIGLAVGWTRRVRLTLCPIK